jgi:hypothetical protein
MQKSNDAILLAQRMIKDLEKNWLPELELVNLHTIFRPVYKHNLTILNINAIVAFVIFAYSEESPWLNVRKDRTINKREVLEGIGVSPDNKIYIEILNYRDDAVQQIILNYLLFQQDARWVEIISLLEYSNKMILFCNQRTSDKEQSGTSVNEAGEVKESYEYLDQSEIAKINKEKGALLLTAIDARAKAEGLIKAIEQDYQKLDSVTQSEFGFAFTNTKVDVLSWESRLRNRRNQNGS